MGSLLRRFLIKPSPFRVNSSFRVIFTNPSPPAISNLPYPLQPSSPDNERSNPNSSPNADYSSESKFQPPIFPSFPFGYSPGLIHPSGILEVPEIEQAERSDETATIWASSVKKKRKTKMNKHKLKKRRKLLRRKKKK